MQIENIVFLQGHEAEPILEMIKRGDEQLALDHLKQWHYPGEHETFEDSHSSQFHDVFTDKNYKMTYSTMFEYVGLEYQIELDEEYV